MRRVLHFPWATYMRRWGGELNCKSITYNPKSFNILFGTSKDFCNRRLYICIEVDLYWLSSILKNLRKLDKKTAKEELTEESSKKICKRRFSGSLSSSGIWKAASFVSLLKPYEGTPQVSNCLFFPQRRYHTFTRKLKNWYPRLLYFQEEKGIRGEGKTAIYIIGPTTPARYSRRGRARIH